MKTIIKFALIASIVLPLRVLSEIGAWALGGREVKNWSLVGILLCLPLWRSILAKGEKEFKIMTVQLNKSTRGLAFKTLCVVLGLVLIISAL